MTRTVPMDLDVIRDLERIVRGAAKRAGVPLEEFRSRRGNRDASRTRIREDAMAEAAAIDIPITQIGWAFGRDHTSVICALRRHRERMARV